MNKSIILFAIACLFAGQLQALPHHQKTSFSAPPQVDADSLHNWDAIHYEVQLRVTPIAVPDSLFIEGETSITFEPEILNLSTVDLSLHNMNVAAVELSGVTCAFNLTNDTLYVFLPEAHNPGDTLTLNITYSGYPEVTGNMLGGVGIHYPSANMIYTHADAFGARNWMPCWDEPWDKATIRQKLIFPSQWKVVANGTFEDSTSQAGWTRWSYYMNYPMATYLISFNAHTNYTTLTQPHTSVDIKHFVYQRHLGAAMVDFSRVPEMIDAFSGFFGQYPFDTFGYAETSLGAAMENQTIVNLGDYFIMGNMYWEIIFAHELAHQWFGDAVSYADWPEMWLSEGFATYSEALWREHLGGMSAYHQYMQSSIRTPYFSWQASNPSYPIYDPPWNLIWCELTYEKPASVMHMLRFHVGDNHFFEILQSYFEAYKYKNASTCDFAGKVEEVTGENYDWYFNQWIFEGGYPEFEYFAAWEPEGEDIMLRVPIAQVQDDPIIDFRTEAELYIFTGADTLIDTITIEALPTQEILITLTDEPDSIQLDPKNWILCSKMRLNNVNLPILAVNDAVIADEGMDGFLDPGESGELSFILANAGLPTPELQLELISSDDHLNVLESFRNVPALSFYDEYDLSADPFIVENELNTGPRWVDFVLEIEEAASGLPVDTFWFALPVGTPELLLVDDDAGGSAEEDHQLSLNNIRRVYRTVEYTTAGDLPPLEDYPAVIWACGEELTNTLTAEDQALLETYLEIDQGALFLSGRGVASDLAQTDFFLNVLHARAIGTTAVPLLNGADPLVEGCSFSIWGDGMNNDIVEPDDAPEADTLLTYFTGQGGAVKYDRAYKTCLLGFGFEDIKRNDPMYDEPEDLLAPVIDWFTGYSVGVGQKNTEDLHPQVFHLGKCYPNPFNAQTIIPISLPESSVIRINLYNIQGQKVAQVYEAIKNAGQTGLYVDLSNLPSAVYFYQVGVRGQESGGKFEEVGKMLLLK